MDTTAKDGTAEDATAELLKKGWTLRRSHQNPATHITMDATAEIRWNPCRIIMLLLSVSASVQANLAITQITN